MGKSTVVYRTLEVPPVRSSLRILTLNCCLLPSGVYQSGGDDDREDRARRIARLVQRYDIVLLQEVFTTFWCTRWKKELTQVPGMHIVVADKRARLLDSGLMILSKYPVLHSSFTRFQNTSLTNHVLERGYLYAELQTPNGSLHVVNTHLNPSECHLGKLSAHEYRENQMREILEFKAQKHKDSEAWVLGGDFNDQEIPQTLLKGYHVSLQSTLPATSHREVSFALTSETPHECIDYLVSNREQIESTLLRSLVSDHYGVEVRLVL